MRYNFAIFFLLICASLSGGQELSYLYDAQGRLQEVQSGDGALHYSYRYDEENRLIEFKDEILDQRVLRRINIFGEIEEEDFGDGLKVQSTYDLFGRRICLVLPDQSFVKYIYDSLYLTKIERYSSEGALQYFHLYPVYGQRGEVVEMALAEAAGCVSFTYDEEGRCSAITSQAWKEQIDYDALGNLIAMSWQDPSGLWEGNFYYDAQNQLVQGPDAVYVYDGEGKRVCEWPEEKNIYTYDALDRLINVIVNQRLSVSFTYDGLHRRLTKSIALWNEASQEWMPQQTWRYIYAGFCEIGCVDEPGRLVELRILGVGPGAEIGAAVAHELNGKVYVPIHDHRGDVSCLIDAESGEVAEYYRYSPFGEVKYYSGEGAILDASALGNPWLFSSKRLDGETGSVFFGRRYYLPWAGRWLTPDPLGSFDGANPYLFLGNNPLSHLDFYGLFSFSDLRQVVVRGTESVIRMAESVVELCCRFREQNALSGSLDLEWNKALERFLGEGFLQLTGFYRDTDTYGTFNPGHEVHDKVRISMINGILNLRSDLENALERLSEAHGGNSIHYVFHPTEGWTSDILTSVLVKFGHVSNRAYLLTELWRQLIDEMGGVAQGGAIFHYAHSIGATETFKAMKLLTAEERKMIHVITFGSPSLIPSTAGFASVVNYVSLRDGVCFLDPLGYFDGWLSAESNVLFLGSPWGIPFIEHTLYSEAYSTIIKELGRKFYETYKKASFG